MRRLVLLGLVLMPLAPATAQTSPGRVAVGGVVQRVQYHVQSLGANLASTIEEQSGTFVGVEGSVRLGMVAVSARSVMGSLAPSGDLAGGPDRASRVTAIAMHLQPSPALAFGPEIEAFRFDTDLGVVAYRFIGVSGRATIPLGSSGLSGSVDGAFFPVSAVSGDAAVSVALRVGVGVVLAPGRGPFFASVGYRLDRIDFSEGGRLEQFRGLTFGAGLRLGR